MLRAWCLSSVCPSITSLDCDHTQYSAIKSEILHTTKATRTVVSCYPGYEKCGVLHCGCIQSNGSHVELSQHLLSLFNRPGTGVSGWRLPADLRRSHTPTSIDGQQCASFDVPITLSVTGVLRPLVHVYGTLCQHNYASVIVSDNLNGCSRLICLVLETVALCDIFVRSDVYKSSHLLNYLSYFLVPCVDYRSSYRIVLSTRCGVTQVMNYELNYEFTLEPNVTAPLSTMR